MNKKEDWFFSSTISDEITAAWFEPRAGRKEQRGAERRDARIESFISFNFGDISLNFFVSCSGILFLSFIEINKEDAPNNPVKRGRRELVVGRFKETKPRNPARRKIKRDINFLSFLIIK